MCRRVLAPRVSSVIARLRRTLTARTRGKHYAARFAGFETGAWPDSGRPFVHRESGLSGPRVGGLGDLPGRRERVAQSACHRNRLVAGALGSDRAGTPAIGGPPGLSRVQGCRPEAAAEASPCAVLPMNTGAGVPPNGLSPGRCPANSGILYLARGSFGTIRGSLSRLDGWRSGGGWGVSGDSGRISDPVRAGLRVSCGVDVIETW